MHRPRYIFMSAAQNGVVWLLFSPNNRQLGKAWRAHVSYQACRDAVLRLRGGWNRIEVVEFADDATGRWVWRVDLDGEPVAGSTRGYLRARECHYNVERFFAAAPQADIVDGTPGRVRGGPPMTPADRLFRGLARGGGALVLVLMLLVGGFLLYRAWDALSVARWSFLTAQEWDPDARRFGVAGVLTGTVPDRARRGLRRCAAGDRDGAVHLRVRPGVSIVD